MAIANGTYLIITESEQNEKISWARIHVTLLLNLVINLALLVGYYLLWLLALIIVFFTISSAHHILFHSHISFDIPAQRYEK